MAGIGELAAEGAVGLAFSLLYTAVSELVNRSKQFKPLLEELIITLAYLKPLIIQIGDGNMELDHPNERVYFKNQLEKGTRLIDKLSTVGSWNLLRPYYSKKLSDLDTSLHKMLLKLIPQGVRDGQLILAEVMSMHRLNRNQLHDQVQKQNSLVGGEIRPTVPYPPSSPVGLDEPLRILKMKLLHDDQVSMLSVTAPGGSGKTTLAQMFCHDQDVKDTFNNMIFFATFSSKPDLEGLQKSLQFFLDQTKENAALLVLDDVWPDSSTSLLENCYQLSQGSSYKILVTSRTVSNYGFNYELDPLTDDEALTLLKNCTSLDYSSGNIDELLEQMVRYCKKSPLAITVVGQSLFKETVEIWEEKITEWSRSLSILESHTALNDRLQISLDVLCEDEPIIRECFTDLASLPEDGRIHAGVLIDMWAELHGLHNDALSIAKLQHLNKRNLAKLVVTRKMVCHTSGYPIRPHKEKEYVDSCYSEQFVTQHDILRELALRQTRQDREGESKRLNIDICGDVLPKRWTQKKEKFKETRLLSVSTDGVFSSKWDNMHLPKAEVLILNFQTKNYALPKFNSKMSEALKVLIVRNNGSYPAKISNLELSSLPNLKRVRLERISISSISLNKEKQLKNLEKISLFMCNTGQASSNSSIRFNEEFPSDLCGLQRLKKKLNRKNKSKNLENLSLFMCNTGQASSNSSIRFFEALPNVVEMNIDYCNDLKELPASVCGLKCLKKLVITNCHNLSALPEEIGKLSNLEVLRLRSCTMLETLKDSMANLKNLEILDISGCLSMKELPTHIGQLSKLKEINMRGCTRLQSLPTSIWGLENILQEVICDEETEELWEPFKSVKNLRKTVVKEEVNLRWLLGH